MEPKLIYHTPQSASGGVSPFDTVITEMVAGHDIRIVSPYLSLDYLRRMIADADSWKLVSDIGEWLSTTSVAARTETVEFIGQHSEQIRHCRDVHAKVLVAGSKALIGSANFTNKGITGRVEMSVLFEDCEHVEETRAWFDLLWSQTAPVADADLKRFAVHLPDREASPRPQELPSLFPPVRAKFVSLQSPITLPPGMPSRQGGSLGIIETLMVALSQAAVDNRPITKAAAEALLINKYGSNSKHKRKDSGLAHTAGQQLTKQSKEAIGFVVAVSRDVATGELVYMIDRQATEDYKMGPAPNVGRVKFAPIFWSPVTPGYSLPVDKQVIPTTPQEAESEG